MTREELKAKYSDHIQNVGDGWHSLVIDMMEEVERLCPGGYELDYVKEKFGGLRAGIRAKYDSVGEHTVPHSKEVQDAVWDIESKFENKSLAICEQCGKPGILRQGGWIKTLCNEHSENRKPMLWEQEPNHICRTPWGNCPDCNEPYCTQCALACYECVHAWRHKLCAKTHYDETNHNGNINDLVYIIAETDRASAGNKSSASLLHG